VSQRLDLFARASRITTANLQEFGFTIGASSQAGGGVRYKLSPAVQLIGDAGIVRYRRRDSLEQQQDGSFLAGANVLLSRGWLQVNAARFSPGEFPAMNDPLHDREVLFAAGEYDIWSRVRVFAGWEGLRTNIDPSLGSDPARDLPRSLAARGLGGLRLQVGGRSTLTLRGEDGDTISRPVRGGLDLESDSGGYSAEWQSAFGSVSSYTRLSWRDNVVRTNAAASYNQRDVSSQLFVRVTRATQLFGVATLTRHETGSATGSSYWQAGGGAQMQLPRRNVWIRGEATTSRNVDLITREFVPRESYNLGVNGELARGLSVAFNVAADRTPLFAGTETPWMTRSMLRITQTFATGSSRAALVPSSRLPGDLRPRGTATVVGTVYADWNANGQQEADEEPLENIPLRIADVASVASSRSGEFLFQGVPAGRMLVGLDTSAVPVDFDLPTFSSMELDLDRGETKRLAFGLIPLGAVHGRVIRDANGNGRADPGEEPVEGAVLVLDGGMRSEQIRKGGYRFEAVRSGSHVVALLRESLPEGAAIAGATEAELTLSRGQLTVAIDFLVSIDKRPELRRVFPSRGGESSAAARAPAAPGRGAPARQGAKVTSTAPSVVVHASAPARETSDATFAVQIAALSDPVRARALARELESSGYTAYVLPPRGGEIAAPYRIRVGGYRSRAAAAAAASRLERQRDEKLWVVREDPR
jgi:hypothetical protein